MCGNSSNRFGLVMSSNWSLTTMRPRRITEMHPPGGFRLALASVLLVFGLACRATDVPDWLRAQVAAPVPAHDEQTNAVAMYAETVLTVQAIGKMTRLQRHAYRILRPDGASLGLVAVEYDPLTQLDSLRAWSIPATGTPFAIKDKEIVDIALQAVDDSTLLSDIRVKAVQIPASVPGSVVGYES